MIAASGEAWSKSSGLALLPGRSQPHLGDLLLTIHLSVGYCWASVIYLAIANTLLTMMCMRYLQNNNVHERKLVLRANVYRVVDQLPPRCSTLRLPAKLNPSLSWVLCWVVFFEKEIETINFSISMSYYFRRVITFWKDIIFVQENILK